VTLIGIDAVIKNFVHLHLFEPVTVWKNFFGIDFHLHYVTNRGGAWGLGAAFHEPLLILRILVILGLGAYLCIKTVPFKKSLFITLILSGAIGNVIDSFLYGHVIDMFHFIFWKRSYGIFNFADGMIFLGGFCLLFAAKKLAPASH